MIRWKYGSAKPMVLLMQQARENYLRDDGRLCCFCAMFFCDNCPVGDKGWINAPRVPAYQCVTRSKWWFEENAFWIDSDE